MALGLAVVLSVMATAGLAKADDRLLPVKQWNRNTRLLLAQAMVSEAGFERANDHIAIAYVLRARWYAWARVAARRLPTFTEMVRAYCSGIGRWVPERLAVRLRWIKALRDPQIGEPDGWPKAYGKWNERHADLWNEVLDRAEAWVRGDLSDPCKGRAKLWGGVGDPKPPRGWSKVECGKTANTFYAPRRWIKEERARQTEVDFIKRVATR